VIHASIIEGYEGEERERMNADLLAREQKAEQAAGPLRYARPGERVAVPFKTVPVNEALAAVAAQMPGGR
jgi:hypothetical protein